MIVSIFGTVLYLRVSHLELLAACASYSRSLHYTNDIVLTVSTIFFGNGIGLHSCVVTLLKAIIALIRFQIPFYLMLFVLVRSTQYLMYLVHVWVLNWFLHQVR